MKKIIFTLITLTSLFVFSQKAKITYIVSTSNYLENLKKSNSPTKHLDAVQNASDIEYSLYINKNKSYYKKEESLEIENNSINITSVLGGRGVYYYDLKTKKNLHEKNTRLGDFLIEYEKLNWELTNETKKIDKYTCLKATTTIVRKKLNGYLEKKIIAWYTPEIALSFGPKNYNGLPGLILTLQEGTKLSLVAKTIDLNPEKDIIITEPTKHSERITYKEYEEIISKRFTNFLQNKQK